jgi:hypothetical protein
VPVVSHYCHPIPPPLPLPHSLTHSLAMSTPLPSSAAEAYPDLDKWSYTTVIDSPSSLDLWAAAKFIGRECSSINRSLTHSLTHSFIHAISNWQARLMHHSLTRSMRLALNYSFIQLDIYCTHLLKSLNSLHHSLTLSPVTHFPLLIAR